MTKRTTSYLFLFIIAITTNAQTWNEVTKAVASDRAPNDQFGNAVGISGNYAIVGAKFEDENAMGLDSLNRAGSAYIFERDTSGNWNEVQKIVASDRTSENNFGTSLSISGNYAIVGPFQNSTDASGGNTLGDAGAAYIFERDSAGSWNEVQKIVASDRAAVDGFGRFISISGNLIIVGVPQEDEDASGANTMADAGSAYIFERDTLGNWSEVQKIAASDRAADDGFGLISISGNYAIVGAGKEDEDASGGNTLLDAGSAYIFERDTSGNWSEVQKIVASDRGIGDNFGITSISGNYAVVGAVKEDEDATGGNTMLDAGSAYIFERDTSGNWSEVQKIVASDRAAGDFFGLRVSISGNRIIVGTPLAAPGSAYIFERDTFGNWNEIQKIGASDEFGGDAFGDAVGISGSYAIVGERGENNDASGANTMPNAGAAYLFENESSVSVQEVSIAPGVLLYPNPSNGRFTIEIKAPFVSPQGVGLEVVIYNVLGEEVHHQIIKSSNLAYRQAGQLIDISNQPKGMYLLTLITEDRILTKRIITN